MAITIVVEDRTGLAGANSYISAADADTYHSNRGRSSWGLLTADAKATALIAGTQFIDSIYNWIGSKSKKTQGLKWPRIASLDDAGNAILLADSDGFDIDTVPQAVVNACAEAAFLSLTEDLFQNSDPRGKIVRKKTDVLETDYQPDSPTAKPAAPTIFGSLNAILKGLYVAPSNGMVVGKAVRG